MKELTRIFKTVGEKKLELLVRYPETETNAPYPLVVMITGGGWAQCVKRDILWFTEPVETDALAAGYAVASLEYRLCTETDMVGIVSDCMDGIRYLVKNASELGIDPGRMAVCGHSAGAHLALMCAMAPQEKFLADSPYGDVSYRMRCCMGFASPAVLTRMDGQDIMSPDLLPKALGEKYGNEAYRALCSPITWVTEDTCPVYLIHGDCDTVVYYQNSLLLRAALEDAGVPCELLTVSGGGHSFESMDPDHPAAPKAKAAYGTVKWFLERYF